MSGIYRFIYISILCFVSLVLTPKLTNLDQTNPVEVKRIDGVTMVAPPSKFPGNPMLDVKKVGAGWISTVPYGFMRIGETGIRFNNKRQWWGETEEGIIKTCQYAQENGIKVMLKPQIWSHTGWIGDQDFETDLEWEEWEVNYTKFIMFYANLASELELEMFCIGTELKNHILKRPDYYKKLIKEIRKIYCGKLIYSANWDSYSNVSFWQDLDYIGLSAYFPINEKVTPSVKYLLEKWKPIVDELEVVSKKYKKPVVFTEYGFLSVDGSGGKTWILEKNVRSLAINEQAQANCFEALYQAFESQSFWAGGFIWKWFPFGKGGEGYNERDYTPQGKLAEQVVSMWYSKW